MGTRRVLTVVIGALALTFGISATVGAQTAAPTPAPAPTNPHWCPGVPESPPPPHFEVHPGDWAYTWKVCSSSGLSRSDQYVCGGACMYAKERWAASHNPPPESPFPQSTNVPQGPIPLPGGGEGYILPLLPSPTATLP
jgi:hypothetical protein